MWVDRNRVSLHNTGKILKNTRIMGKIVGKLWKKIGILWEYFGKFQKKVLKIAGRNVGYLHSWESVPIVRINIPTVRTKIPMLRRKFPINSDKIQRTQINSNKFR